MRITTIPFSFTLATTAEGYQASTVLPRRFKITHLYALGEPSPSQLLYVQIFKWPSGILPTAGVPSGRTIFDDLIIAPRIRLGRIPVDMNLDIDMVDTGTLLCYANNGAATTQQCVVELEVALPD